MFPYLEYLYSQVIRILIAKKGFHYGIIQDVSFHSFIKVATKPTQEFLTYK